MHDVEISPATEAEATDLPERSKETYVESLQRRRGLSPQEARAKADADTDGPLPQGVRTPGMVFLTARRDGQVLGGVWAAVQGPDGPARRGSTSSGSTRRSDARGSRDG